MKKCVKCGRRFDDSALKCPDCQLYLIKDTVSDMTSGVGSAQTGKRTSARDTAPPTQERAFTASGSGSARPKRGRVEPINGEGGTTVSSPFTDSRNGSRNPGSGFRPSRETAGAPANPFAASGRSGMRRTRSRNLLRALRHVVSALRYALPMLLMLASVLFIALNWDVVYGVIQCCIIGGIVGGCLLTGLSAVGHHFSPEATIVGIIGGMVLSCILTYNLFDVTSELGALLYALSPCIIVVACIHFMIRRPR